MANALTLFRLILVPVFMALLVWPGLDAARPALFVFLLAALTDFVDGYVARHMGRVTTFGRIVDPVADRMLIVAGVVGLFIHGDIPAWSIALLLTREGSMLAGYGLAVRFNKPVVKINLFGRFTNFYLMGSITLLLFGRAYAPSPIYLWLFYLGVVLYVTSGLVYIIREVQLAFGSVKEI